MERVTTIADLRGRVSAARADGRRIGLVPTMGALHEGHLSLVRHVATLADLVVVSIFVNPTQFAAGEDLDAYPRDLDGDEAALAALGDATVDLVFAPDVDEVYPDGTPLTTVHVAGLTDRLCGASRPGHFDGVATVVSKLHNLVAPDVAVYGRKDFQQLQVIRRMVADLNQPVEVVGAPIVREPDGVAMSSRNAYLQGEDRAAARTLSQALRAGVEAARAARRDGAAPAPGMIEEAVRVIMSADPRVRIDYVDVLDPDTLAPVTPAPPDATRGQAPGPDAYGPPTGESPLLVAVAAHVGPARLIDNVVIGDADDEDRLLAATS